MQSARDNRPSMRGDDDGAASGNRSPPAFAICSIHPRATLTPPLQCERGFNFCNNILPAAIILGILLLFLLQLHVHVGTSAIIRATNADIPCLLLLKQKLHPLSQCATEDGAAMNSPRITWLVRRPTLDG